LCLWSHLGCISGCVGRPKGQGTTSPPQTSWGSYLTSCGSYQTSQGSYLNSWGSCVTLRGSYLAFVGFLFNFARVPVLGVFGILIGCLKASSPAPVQLLGLPQGERSASSEPSWVRLGLLWASHGPGHHCTSPNFVGVLFSFVWVLSSFAGALCNFVGILVNLSAVISNFVRILFSFARTPVS
jgi:hypothetical protein